VGAEEVVFGAFLVIALVALSCYYAWRQLRILRQPGGAGDPATIEGLYRSRQVRRRLISSGLMLLLAAQLAGALIYLQQTAQRQGERAVARADARQRGEQVEPTPEEKSFVRFYTFYWLVFMLVLLWVVALAFSDLWATRRFALSAHRQLQVERRDMIDREIARLRQEKQERNGHG
jgi:hypothetical protein